MRTSSVKKIIIRDKKGDHPTLKLIKEKYFTYHNSKFTYQIGKRRKEGKKRKRTASQYRDRLPKKIIQIILSFLLTNACMHKL